jgi:hypothetical protein
VNAESPIVEEVRCRAMAISARYEHDLQKYAEHLRQIEAENASRVVSQLTVVRSAPTSGKA